MSTPRDLITAAIARSSKNRPLGVAAAEAELLALVQRTLRACAAVAARVNPTYFGTNDAVAGVGGVWVRPADAESVYWIETADGDPVTVVPIEDRDADGIEPRLYREGAAYHTVGGAADPAATDTLTFRYSRRLEDPATIDTALEAGWPTAYDPLIIEEVAVYLAVKDGRSQEAAELRVGRDSWLRLYLAFLDHELANEERRFHPRRLVENTQIPLAGLFTGGTDVKV
jgi:hypothetical protein